MAIVDIDDLKSQLRIDHDDEDDVLEQKLDAAQNHIERLLGFKVEEEYTPSKIPDALKEGVLQLAAFWFENREAVLVGETAQALPAGLDDIVREYRNWSWAG